MAAPKPPKSPPPLSTKIVPPSTSGNPTATIVATASLIVFVRDILGGALEGAEVTLVDPSGVSSEPQISDANGRVVFAGAIKVTTAKAPKPTAPVKLEAPPTVSTHRLVARLPTAPGWFVVDDALEVLLDGLVVDEVVTGPNVRTLRLGKPFEPKCRYAWQNPRVRDELYPGRKGALRSALHLYTQLEVYSVPPDDPEQIAVLRHKAEHAKAILDEPAPVPTMTNIAGEWFRRDLLPDPPRGKELAQPVRVRRWAVAWDEALDEQRPHERLMVRLLDFFDRRPDLVPPWLQFMIVHFSGLRYSTAHLSYSRPTAILAELRRQEYEQQLGLKNTFSKSPIVHKRAAALSLLDELRHEAWALVSAKPDAYRSGLADALAGPLAHETSKLVSVLHDFAFDDLRRRVKTADNERGTGSRPNRSHALSLLDHRSRDWPAAARKTVISQSQLRLAVTEPGWYIDLGGPQLEGWKAHRTTIPEAYADLMERFFWGNFPDWRTLGKVHQGKLNTVSFVGSGVAWRPDFLDDPDPTLIGTAVCDQVCSLTLHARNVLTGKPSAGGLTRNAEHYGMGKAGTTWVKAGTMLPPFGASFFNAFWQDSKDHGTNDYKSISKATLNVWPSFNTMPGWNYHENISEEPGMGDVVLLVRLPKKPPWVKQYLDWQHQGIVLQQQFDEDGDPINSYLSFQTAVDMSVAMDNRTGVVRWIPTGTTWLGSRFGESEQSHPGLSPHLERSRLLLETP